VIRRAFCQRGKNGLAGSRHDMWETPGESAFNAAPIKGARLSLSIVRPMPKAVNYPRVVKTKKLLCVARKSHLAALLTELDL
jgi:hypothetical protein